MTTLTPEARLTALRAVPLIVAKVWPDGADAEVPDYAALSALVESWLTAQAAFEAGWAAALDLMATVEGEITSDSRHTKEEIRGAHMLGAATRARAAAQQETP